MVRPDDALPSETEMDSLARPDEPLLKGGEEDLELPGLVQLPLWPTVCLCLGHVSCTFNCAAFGFALSLFLTEIYGDTLVPLSLIGLCRTLAGIAFAGWMGDLVDSIPRLRFMKIVIAAEKILHAGNYLVFSLFLYFLPGHMDLSSTSIPELLASWSLLIATIVIACMLSLVMTGMTLGIQRDWVTVIAQGDEAALTRLNTYLRRIDLLGGIAAPLLVSSLTPTIGYSWTFVVFSCIAALCFVLEFWWIDVVHRSFSLDRREEVERHPKRLVAGLAFEKAMWEEFGQLPIFWSSLAIAATYFSTLIIEGSYIVYVKTDRSWPDSTIGIQKALSEAAGVLGTLVMPLLENRYGTGSAGLFSVLSMAVCLLPVVVSLFLGRGFVLDVVIFVGTLLSRVGMWSFDLCQLKLLQLALEHHPYRNRLAALQLALQNLFSLLRFLTTLLASTPSNFKWTGLLSLIAIIGSAWSYGIYIKRSRC